MVTGARAGVPDAWGRLSGAGLPRRPGAADGGDSAGSGWYWAPTRWRPGSPGSPCRSGRFSTRTGWDFPARRSEAAELWGWSGAWLAYGIGLMVAGHPQRPALAEADGAGGHRAGLREGVRDRHVRADGSVAGGVVPRPRSGADRPGGGVPAVRAGAAGWGWVRAFASNVMAGEGPPSTPFPAGPKAWMPTCVGMTKWRHGRRVGLAASRQVARLRRRSLIRLPEDRVLQHAVAAVVVAQQPVAGVAVQRVRLPADGHSGYRGRVAEPARPRGSCDTARPARPPSAVPGCSWRGTGPAAPASARRARRSAPRRRCESRPDLPGCRRCRPEARTSPGPGLAF